MSLSIFPGAGGEEMPLKSLILASGNVDLLTLTHIHINSRPHRRDKRPLFPLNKGFFCQMLYTFMRICLLWHIPHGQQQRRLVQHLNAVKVMLWPTPYRVATTHRIPVFAGHFPPKNSCDLWLICGNSPIFCGSFADRDLQDLSSSPRGTAECFE